MKLAFVFVEPAVWKLTAEVQEQQRLAEAVGGLHQLQPVLLQVSPGDGHSLSALFVQPPPRCVYSSPGLKASHLGVECRLVVPRWRRTGFHIPFPFFLKSLLWLFTFSQTTWSVHDKMKRNLIENKFDT